MAVEDGKWCTLFEAISVADFISMNFSCEREDHKGQATCPVFRDFSKLSLISFMLAYLQKNLAV